MEINEFSTVLLVCFLSTTNNSFNVLNFLSFSRLLDLFFGVFSCSIVSWVSLVLFSVRYFRALVICFQCLLIFLFIFLFAYVFGLSFIGLVVIEFEFLYSLLYRNNMRFPCFQIFWCPCSIVIIRISYGCIGLIHLADNFK